jgi:hypothetical protein
MCRSELHYFGPLANQDPSLIVDIKKEKQSRMISNAPSGKQLDDLPNSSVMEQDSVGAA